MFGLFQSNTPQYAGSGQPTASNREGAFGFLSGLLALSTPPYATVEAKLATATGAIQSQTPTREPKITGAIAAPVLATDPAVSEQGSEANDPGSVPACGEVVRPACSVPLPFAIVIQRPE